MRKLQSFALVLGALCTFSAPVQGFDGLRDTWTFHTDDTWRVTATSPGAGWNSEVDFDESGGGWIVPWSNDMRRIWHTSNQSRQSPGRVWFRRILILDEHQARLERLRAYVYFDDNGEAFINGVRIVDDRGGGASEFFLEVDPSLLRPGRNVIAGMAWNTIHPYNSARISLTGTVRTGMTATPLVTFGAEWLYLDDGSDQGTAWRSPNYDDSAWSIGAAELGYGDGDESTTVDFGSDPQNRHVTTYFRKSFDVTNPDAILALDLGIRRDDGAAVYLNGTEVARTNLAENAPFDQLASGATDDGNATFAFGIDPELLQGGSNLLAVEVHQTRVASSDLSFDLELRAVIEAARTPGSTLPVSMDFDDLDVGVQSAPSAPGQLGFHTVGNLSGGLRGVSERGEYVSNDSNGEFSIHFDPVEVPGAGATLSIDLRTWENSETSDFESDDFVRATLTRFPTATGADSRVLLDVSGAGLKALDRGPTGPSTTLQFEIPPDFKSACLVLDGRTDSSSEWLFLGRVAFTSNEVPFRRGRVNDDDSLDLSDTILILLVLFRGRGPLGCEKAADVNDSGEVDLSDVIWMLEYFFLSGPQLADPFDACGPDPTEDALSCESAAACSP